jgi:Domain of unknown function (DUF4258)
LSKKQSLTPVEATAKIRLIIDQGSIKFSRHCRLESMPKRNVDDEDIIAVLETGHVIEQAEWDNTHNSCKYKVEGFDLAGDELRVITVIFDINFSLLVVTVF